MTNNAPHLRGKVEILDLEDVSPNPWNANVVPEHVMESIRHGFSADGWLVSQALLIWGSDEAGKPQNLIIDGEHRWTAALDVGMDKGPMVVLQGVTEAEAKALTIKINQKRGEWNPDALASLVFELSSKEVSADQALDFGFSLEELSSLIAVGSGGSNLEGVPPPADKPEESETPEQLVRIELKMPTRIAKQVIADLEQLAADSYGEALTIMIL